MALRRQNVLSGVLVTKTTNLKAYNLGVIIFAAARNAASGVAFGKHKQEGRGDSSILT